MRELKVLTGRTIIINLPDTALRGVIESATRDTVTLIDAVAVQPTGETPLSGLLVVPSTRIDFVQVV